MKKYIFFLSTFLFLVACSTKKDAFVNRTYQSFTAYYNTLFHGKEALKSEIEKRKKEHKDNFYDGYIEILSQNNLPEKEDDALNNISSMASQFFGENKNSSPQQPSGNALKKAEEKALKIIQKKSMVFKGVEKNPEVFNAYILLVEAKIHQGKLFEALESINQIYLTMSKDKRLPLAKIYEGFIHSKMKNYIRAEDIFFTLEKDTNLKKEYKKLLSIYSAENYLYSNKKEAAIQQLDLAMNLHKSREIKSRIAFQKGQILAELGRKEKARESFVQAYQYSNDFEFEVKSQIEIAKTFNAGDDYEEAKKYLEKISNKGVYASRKNEFYYALGLMANKAGQKEEAKKFFQQSVKEKISDNNIRGLAYFELGKSFFDKDDYIAAGAYYDSALVSIQHLPTKEKISELASNIKKFSQNYYLIKKNDSILALTEMPEYQQVAYFQKYIEELKIKEEKKRLAEIEKKKKNQQVDFDFPNSNFANVSNPFNTQKSGKFYFSNPETIAKGSLEFKKVWGNRNLGDNWRVSQNASASIDEIKNKALDRESVADARRFEVAYYIEKIPTNAQTISQLKKDRDTASLGLGRMYEDFFQNTPLATKTLEHLVIQKPEEEVKLQALYSIFSINFEKNPTVAEKAKTLILQEFPYTPYAEFVKNPRRKNNITQSNNDIKQLYQKAYRLFEEEKFADAQNIIKNVIKENPSDALIPKFELLNAFIAGKTAGKDIMELQLQQIIFNYEKTPEGRKAKEMLSFLNKKIEETPKNTVDNTPTPPQEEPKLKVEPLPSTIELDKKAPPTNKSKDTSQSTDGWE